MVYLKEDGSLDIEKINNLPFEESIDVMADFTSAQMEEYISKLPLNESKEPYQGVRVNYTLEEEIERRTAVDIEEYLYNKRKKYGIIK